ncbi:hypothetical protein FB451DRAFT_74212 [Mycena latifolia]|nr:hypothetical protein FB451DRAFT_74212 [Mycena latifolia]
MFAGSLLLIFCLLEHILFTSAQTSNATCAPSYKWAFNSQQQSPCVVASALLAVCTGCEPLMPAHESHSSEAAYEVSALPEQWHYSGPDSIQDANPCQCNTVVYSLLAECGLCQNRTAIMWSIWETNCASVTIGSFPEPIPVGLHVPGWAYLDVKTADMFNETLAQANANITESTAVPQPTKTPAASVSVASSSTIAQTTTESQSSNVSLVNQTRSNAIGGGIVGGFTLLVLVCCLAFWIHRRRRTARANGEILDSPAMSQYRSDTLPSQPTIPKPVPSIVSVFHNCVHITHSLRRPYRPYTHN